MEDWEEEVSSHWLILRNRESTGKWIEEALDRNLWRTRSGRGYGPAVRRTTEWMN